MVFVVAVVSRFGARVPIYDIEGLLNWKRLGKRRVYINS